jgi:hypothetical protein
MSKIGNYMARPREVARTLFEERASALKSSVPEAVGEVEAMFDLRFPVAYREYLLWAGGDSGFFCGGQYCATRHLVRANVWARDLIHALRSDFTFDSNHFVFSWDVSQTFYFFRVDGNDDPPVKIFMDPALAELTRQEDSLGSSSSRYSFLCDSSLDNQPVEFASSFSTFLIDNLVEVASHFRQ